MDRGTSSFRRPRRLSFPPLSSVEEGTTRTSSSAPDTALAAAAVTADRGGDAVASGVATTTEEEAVGPPTVCVRTLPAPLPRPQAAAIDAADPAAVESTLTFKIKRPVRRKSASNLYKLGVSASSSDLALAAQGEQQRRGRSASPVEGGPRRSSANDNDVDESGPRVSIRRNNISFCRNESESALWSAAGETSDGDDAYSYSDMEVMDLRDTGGTCAGLDLDTSMVSFSSRLTMDGMLLSGGMWRPAGGGSDPVRISPSPDNDNDHLRRHLRGEGGGGAVAGGPGEERERARRALMRIASGRTYNVDPTGRRGDQIQQLQQQVEDGHDDAKSVSGRSGKSGFWSAIGKLPDEESSEESGSDKSSRRSGDGATGSVKSGAGGESSRIAEQRRRSRQLYVRRCARAMMVFAALAVLSGAFVYLEAAEDFDIGGLLDVIPHHDLSRYFNRNDRLSHRDGSKQEEEVDQRRLPQDKQKERKERAMRQQHQQQQAAMKNEGHESAAARRLFMDQGSEYFLQEEEKGGERFVLEGQQEYFVQEQGHDNFGQGAEGWNAQPFYNQGHP